MQRARPHHIIRRRPALRGLFATQGLAQRALFSSTATSASSKRYDYVIVGAGSAGCVVAHRLAEANYKVLLVEAGRRDRGSWDWWKVQMPSALAFNVGDNKFNWDFHTTPQKHCDQRVFHAPRGKTLGGSSALNAMAYVRGNAEDYERWARETGTEEWGYKYCLPYYQKCQTHVHGGDAYRGAHGPLHVSQKETKVSKELNQAFVTAGVQAGYPATSDQNGYRQEGFGPMDMTVNFKTGERETTANAYLDPRKHPDIVKNIDVRVFNHVVGLTFDDTVVGEPKVSGISVLDTSKHQPWLPGSETSGGEVVHFEAAKEVILCAGSVGSVQLLQLAGIGAEEHLKEVGIKPRVHLPEVGENLEDHLEYYLQYLCNKPISLYPLAATFGSSKYLFRQPWNPVMAGVEWMLRGTGTCASNHFEVGAFIRTAAGIPHPDVQFHFIPGCVVGQLEFLAEHGYQAHIGTMRPTSRGTIKIRSADPLAAPEINPNYLSTPEDVKNQRDAFRLGVEIMEQPVFQELSSGRYNFADVDIDDDAQVDSWIRQTSHSGYHLSCTNKMGKVVDPRTAQVYGVRNLRVVDASIFPSMSSGNLNAPTIMTAEKMSDAILGRTWTPDEVTWFKADTSQQRGNYEQ